MAYQSVFKPGIFNDKVFLVTGGGSGIGRCTAHEIAALGGTVIIAGRNQDKLDKVSAEIKAQQGKIDTVVMDIRDESRVQEVIASLVEKYGKIDGLLNNAGGQFPAPLEHINKKGFDAVVQNNLTGGFLVAREVFRQSMKRNGGSIVNITADNLNGMPIMGHSGAARAGMENLTKTAAWEWGPFGVRVNAVAPGWVASSGFDTYDDRFKAVLVKVKDHVPLKRLANEAEISSAICFLFSDGSAYINGTTIRIDGGSAFGSAPAISPLPKGPASSTLAYDGFHLSELPQVLQE